MDLLEVTQQLEAPPELGMQPLGVVTRDIEATALHGSVGPERADDHVAAWPHGAAGQRAVDSDRSEVARHVTLGMQALRSPADVSPPEEPLTWPSARP